MSRSRCSSHFPRRAAPDGGDGRRIFRGSEDRRAGDDGIGAGRDRASGVLRILAAIHGDPWLESALFAQPPQRFDFRQDLGQEFLATESGIDRHDEEHVAEMQHALDERYWARRVKNRARFFAEIADTREHSVQVNGGRRLGLHEQVVRSSLREGLHVTLGLYDHEVHVERLRGTAAHCFDDGHPEGDVRHESAVHDVDVDPVGARAVHGAHFLAEPAEVRGKNGRRHDERPHWTSSGASTNRSIAFAKPSSLYESVTQSACAFTSSLALPIAMLRPLLENISTSFGMSPMVAISPARTASRRESVATTVPLFAAG